MLILCVGLILLVLKWFEVGVVANWSWWWIFLPFALTVLWWSWADASGYTKRKEIEKIDKKKQARLDRYREQLHRQKK
jgi:small Trp-rich protein